MDKIKFQEQAEYHINKLNELIEKMPEKGLKSTESQKVYLQNALNSFEYAVNGVEEEDFLPTASSKSTYPEAWTLYP